MRKIALFCFFAGFVALGASAQETSWKGIKNISLSAATENFQTPPSEYASHVIWGWEGQMDIKTIKHDLDSIKTKGFRSVIFEAGYRLPYQYLSKEWFEGIKTAVKEAKKRDLKVWIIDEGKYPSGFAGGKFSKERPEMRMKAVVTVGTIPVEKNSVIKGLEISPKAISALAVSRSGAPNRTVIINNGKIDFEAGNDAWDISLVGTDYRTGQTRAVNNPTGGKDTSNSLCDYLSPEAVRQFIDWTHEQYKKYIGDEFGKTVLGFRGDEPDFAYTPWTPKMKEEFFSRKGYDPTPYLASLSARTPTLFEKRFRADYWDVWSELFSVNFFKQQADWCEANGLAHITHLNSDDNMPACIRMDGDFFRDLSKVQIPGVDAIWNQIWPGTDNDFPKFASSVSHVYGKPRAFSESFAAYNTSPSIPQAKYVVDYQIVRGINFFEFMFWMAGSQSKNWMTDPAMKSLNDYTNRATYLMSVGQPGARVAVYYPTSTFWMNNQAISKDLVTFSQLLLTHQRDFDWVNDDAFNEILSLKSGDAFFENGSGQKYYTLIIPSCEVISEAAWNKIAQFAKNGGKVLFWGRRPTMMTRESFIEPASVPDLKECFEEPSISWTPTVESAMPQAEVSIILPKPERSDMMRRPQGMQLPQAVATDDVRYTRRIMADGDLYFLFNEGEQSATFKIDFNALGQVKLWDAQTGTISDTPSSVVDGKTRLEMTLAPWESKIISIRK